MHAEIPAPATSTVLARNAVLAAVQVVVKILDGGHPVRSEVISRARLDSIASGLQHLCLACAWRYKEPVGPDVMSTTRALKYLFICRPADYVCKLLDFPVWLVQAAFCSAMHAPLRALILELESIFQERPESVPLPSNTGGSGGTSSEALAPGHELRH
ncbi:unnamed protein product [Polarella glacialis]|uniref:Uncharacterized protein n=1 Tax=Polarella glacialis TaxID=89957 RepID=A0A813E7Q2_POLGL|nr:unnamed protein product [Polarella glacialis]